jgi:Zn-dependent protease
MYNLLLTSPFAFFVWVSALLVAITVHEFAHAWMSDRLGDPTARFAGRLTLNPIAHLDPIGTLMLLFFRFGWGKPVPVDPYNLRHPRRDSALISLAGPSSNIILAVILAVLIRSSHIFIGTPAYLVETILAPFIYMSVILGIFNLIPIHPLDGGKILIGILPAGLADEWDRILEQYGLILLIILIFPIFGPSPVSLVISPIINLILNLLLPGAPLV